MSLVRWAAESSLEDRNVNASPVDTRRPVVCFVDDDEAELRRFEAAMAGRFRIVTGTGYESCKRQLDAQGLEPGLWVLDLFFPASGQPNTPKELEVMADKYRELEQHVREFRLFLTNIGQGPEGGVELLQKCLRHHRVPVIMFTRKGTLDDALNCLDKGASAVLKKATPSTLTGDQEEKKRQLDEAMAAQANYLTDKFQEAIDANHWWKKHRGIIGFISGAILSGLISTALTKVL